MTDADILVTFPHIALRIRMPLALIIGLGSNGVMIAGLFSLERHRFRGIVLCSLAVAMFIGGMGLMLSVGMPATWDWPV